MMRPKKNTSHTHWNKVDIKWYVVVTGFSMVYLHYGISSRNDFYGMKIGFIFIFIFIFIFDDFSELSALALHDSL